MKTPGSKPAQRTLSAGLLPALLAILALALRMGRLGWQPLWWDEGYSVYFATEPLGRMLWLTAHDIHPPLYYALLHLWSLIFGHSPVALRLLSVAIGAIAVVALAWLGRILYPQRLRVAWIAALLLAVSPIHLFYSQEVRMYALAMLLCILATGWLWRALFNLQGGAPARRELILYALFAALALYTLYYTALLLAAQALWALWLLRRRRTTWPALGAAWLAVLLAYLPWLVYALPKLVAYVAQKVGADSDKPLNLIDYALRHGRALLAGHIAPTSALNWAALALTLIALTLLLALAFAKRSRASHTSPSPARALLLFMLLPAAGAFLLNLRLPFFPEGGERLLLFILPFLLLLIARAADVALDARARAALWLARLALAGLTVAGLLGVFLFYTTPRYTQEDYRPIIRQAVQQGGPGDTFLATFPWMVGYWRAYAPDTLGGPAPLLLGDFAVTFGPQVIAQVDEAVARGTLWFPEPLGFGSTLPGEIEAHLRTSALNVENRWASLTNRLSAWAALHAAQVQPINAAFSGGPVLSAAGVQAGDIVANNRAIATQLDWQGIATSVDNPLSVYLRLVDGDGREWAARAYSPPGSLAHDNRAQANMSEFAGLLAPAGTPPGAYTVTVGLSNVADGNPRSADVAGALLQAVPVGTITLNLPAEAPALEQLPINNVVRRPGVDEGLSLIGARLPETPVLAGTTALMYVAAENRQATPPQRELYLSLVGKDGASVATWQGWSLPDFPTALWPQGARILVPVALDIPATVAAGRYAVMAGWASSADGSRTPAVEIGALEIERRAASLAALPSQQPLNPAPLFGTHVVLEGYTITQTGQSLLLALDWRVEQPLLPAHHIFVHANDPTGATLAQSDGPPTTATGTAPTGTWQPGEHLRTLHALTLPAGAGDLALRVGLYNPVTDIRLPVSIDNAPAGDAVPLATVTAP